MAPVLAFYVDLLQVGMTSEVSMHQQKLPQFRTGVGNCIKSAQHFCSHISETRTETTDPLKSLLIHGLNPLSSPCALIAVPLKVALACNIQKISDALEIFSESAFETIFIIKYVYGLYEKDK